MKNSKLIFSLFVLMSVLTNRSLANSPKEAFQAANKAFRSGQYEASARAYEDLLRGGNAAPEVYFNLGNCYYKLQEYPKAILNYERARRLSPLDEDIAYNLRLAYAGTVDKIEPLPMLFYERWWEGFLQSLSPSAWSLVAVTLCWLALGLGVWYVFAKSVAGKKASFLSGITVFFLACMVFLIARSADSRLNGKKDAIVMELSTYIKSSPDEKSTNLFLLHSGTKVEVIDELGNWKQIRIANGNTGWIHEQSISLI